MKNLVNRKNVFVLFLILISFSNPIHSQAAKLGGLGEISEIIIPGAASMQNSNMYYEVHVMNTDYPSPSFWYKIIFKEACQFEFTLFPIGEDDGYDFYFFKVEDNMDFCEAIQADKLESCNSARIYKQYTDAKNTSTDSQLSNIRAISVKENDAIYIEVFATVGNDCGHILDFQTSTYSFVIKVINDKCKNGQYTSEYEQAQYTPVFTAKEATRIFSNTVCYLEDGPKVSIIKAEGDQVVIKKNVDFKQHSKDEADKYTPPQKDSILIEPVPVVVKKDSIIVDSIPETTAVKSTSDLNVKADTWAPIKHDMVNIKSKKAKHATRLDVDYALFSLLKEDLKRKVASNRNQTKDYYNQYKKASGKKRRAEIKATIAETKIQKEELLAKSRETKAKLKQIQKLLNENRKKAVESGNSVFAKSVYTVDTVKQSTVDAATTNAIIENPQLPSGLIYKIQIGVYRNKISKDIFKGLSPLSSQSFPGGIKYYVGAFRHYTDARNAKKYIKTMGLTDAFIVAFYNGERVVVKEARLHESR